MIGAHFNQQGALIAPWGKLCDVCGGSGSLFKPSDKKFINYIKCSGKPTEGIYCRDGLGLTLYQDPSTFYFEEMGSGYHPSWVKAGTTRADHLKSKEHSVNNPPFIMPERVQQEVRTPDQQKVYIPKEAKKMSPAGKLYWKVINAIEYPFKAIGRQYNRWFGPQGSLRLQTEKLIGTEVQYKPNPVTYSADRIITNKWITLWRKTFQHGTHHINGDKWWTVQAQTSKNQIELTWRQNVGWCMTHRKIGKRNGFTVRYHPLIWRIKSGMEKHWPAPVWETMH